MSHKIRLFKKYVTYQVWVTGRKAEMWGEITDIWMGSNRVILDIGMWNGGKNNILTWARI